MQHHRGASPTGANTNRGAQARNMIVKLSTFSVDIPVERHGIASPKRIFPAGA
jgi:hypothetical protein